MSNQAPPVQAQWALNETTSGAITMSRGLLQAATSDNISPVALMACESFGCLLPATPETRLKIEQLARRCHTSHVFNFLSVQIGYLKGDSVDFLSRSDGGIRFLCLMATFCTMPRFEAAMRLDQLLGATQSKGQLRPTITQLQNLGKVLENKLGIADFATQVVGWETWFIKQLEPIERASLEFAGVRIPSKTALQKLILVLNETNRLGEERSIVVTTIADFVPWLLAFIKWTIGLPPDVRLESGRTLNVQQKPHIILVVTSYTQSMNVTSDDSTVESKSSIQIATAFNTAYLHSVVVDMRQAAEREPLGLHLGGLITASAAMDWILGKFLLEFNVLAQNQELLKAISDLLLLITAFLPDRLMMGHDTPKIPDLGNVSNPGLFCTSSFPRMHQRLSIAKNLLKDSHVLAWPDVDSLQFLENGKLMDKEQLAKYFKNKLLPILGVITDTSFFPHLGQIAAWLLSMSLLGTTLESLPKVLAEAYVVGHYDSWTKLVVKSWRSLLTLESQFVSWNSSGLSNSLASMLVNRENETGRSRILNSSYGQVYYPAILEARGFLQDGSQQLCVHQGSIIVGGTIFEAIVDSLHFIQHTYDERHLRLQVGSEEIHASYISPRFKAYEGGAFHWTLNPQDLYLSCTLCMGDRLLPFTSSILTVLPWVILSKDCDHPSDDAVGELTEPVYFCSYASTPSLADGQRWLWLVSAGRRYEQQVLKVVDISFRTASGPVPVLVHTKGCLRCAIDFSLDIRARVLVS